MKKIYLFLSLFLFAIQATAQTSWLWAHNILGGLHNAYTTGIATDADGNVYVTGNFTGTLALNNEYFTSLGGNDIFCVKYGPAGQPLWVRAFGGRNDDNSSSIVVDAGGRVFIAGYFTDTISFGDNRLISTGSKEMYLTKLNGDGTTMWTRSWGTELDDAITGLCTDKNGDIIFTATFSTYNSSPHVYNSVVLDNDTLTSTGDGDILLVKINSDAQLLWATHAGGKSNDAAGKLAVDAEGNIFIAGNFYSKASFDSLQIAFPAGEPDGAFVAKYNTAGKALWVQKLPSSSPISLALDSRCHVYALCFFHQIVFGGYGGQVTETTNYTLTNYDSSGNFSWQKVIDPAALSPADIAVDKLDQLYMTGRINHSILLDGIPLNAIGHGDIFVVTIDSNAQANSAETIGAGAGEAGTALCFDPNNNLLLTGATGTQPVLFGAQYITAYNDADVFIAKRGMPTSARSFSALDAGIIAYPTPTDKMLYISIPSAKGDITLADALGRVVYSQYVSHVSESINTSQLATGIYYLRYASGDISVTRKILVQH